MYVSSIKDHCAVPTPDAPALKIFFWPGSIFTDNEMCYRMMYENDTLINLRNNHEYRNFVETRFMDGSPDFRRPTENQWRMDNGESELLAWVNEKLLPYNAKIVGFNNNQDLWTSLFVEFKSEKDKLTFILMYL